MWEAHDPTTLNSQGNDVGTQCIASRSRSLVGCSCSERPAFFLPVRAADRSGFYWVDDEQKQLIMASKGAYEKALGRPIVTECAAASDYDEYGGCFYYGEDYHRMRHSRHCHTRGGLLTHVPLPPRSSSSSAAAAAAALSITPSPTVHPRRAIPAVHPRRVALRRERSSLS